MTSLRELFASVRNTFANRPDREDHSEEPAQHSSKLPGTHPDAPDYGARLALVRENKLDELKAAFATYDLDTTNMMHNVCSPEMVDLLVGQGVDVNGSYKESAITQDDEWNDYHGKYDLTPLQSAAAQQDVPTVQRLIDHGADLNVGDGVEKEKTIALAMAASRKDDQQEAVVRTLLDAGAKVEGTSIMATAARDGASTETLRMLLEAGANPNERPYLRRDALSFVAERGRGDAVDLLLDYGAHPNGSPMQPGEELEGWSHTPLQEAAMHGKIDVVNKLVARGADPAGVNSLNPEGNHMLAVSSRYAAFTSDNTYRAGVDALLDHGVDMKLVLASPALKEIPREKLDPRIVAEQEKQVPRHTFADAEQEHSTNVAESPTQPVARRRVRL